ICLKAMAKDPDRRYGSAKALAEDLDRFAAGEAIFARPDRSWQKHVRRLRKHSVAAALALLAVGSVLLAGLFWLGRVAEAQDDLVQGRAMLDRGALAEAEARFEEGAKRLQRVPFAAKIKRNLKREY